MLHPAPTSKIDPSLARGLLEAVHPETATKPAYAVLTFHNTSYRLHVLPVGPITAEPGKRIIGIIRADAKRVDKVSSGGRYVEPVFGRPRRVQGRVIATDNTAGTITVNAGVPICCRLTDERQRATEFEPGDFVSFDVLRGASFEQTDA
jgi:hypothetical protein